MGEQIWIMLRAASSDQHPQWNNISTSGISDWSLGLKIGFQSHTSALYCLSFVENKGRLFYCYSNIHQNKPSAGKGPRRYMQDLSSILTNAYELVVCSHGTKYSQHTYNKNLISFMCCFKWWSFAQHLVYSWPGLTGDVRFEALQPNRWEAGWSANGWAAFLPSDCCSFHTPDCKSCLG